MPLKPPGAGHTQSAGEHKGAAVSLETSVFVMRGHCCADCCWPHGDYSSQGVRIVAPENQNFTFTYPRLCPSRGPKHTAVDHRISAATLPIQCPDVEIYSFNSCLCLQMTFILHQNLSPISFMFHKQQHTFIYVPIAVNTCSRESECSLLIS